MPTYDYVCDSCGHEFEAFQGITEDALRKCPECGKNKLRRLIGAGAGLIFKGSGFYITDYKGKARSTSPASSATGSGSSGSDSSAETTASKTKGESSGAAKSSGD